MFGADDRPDEVGDYQEAVRRGGALLTVTVVDEAHVGLVRSTLHEAGAVDIDERVAQWKSNGYAGFDSTAKAYTPDEVAADRKAFAVTRESLDVGKREVETGGVRVEPTYIADMARELYPTQGHLPPGDVAQAEWDSWPPNDD